MKFNKQVTVVFTLFSLFAIFACDDTVDVNLESADSILNVDAWINNKLETQVIQLTLSQSYFDNSTPTGVTGAVVTVNDNLGNVFSFTENTKKNGYYEWTPAGNVPFGIIDREYTLLVKYKGEIFTSSTQMKRTTKVDSITFSTESNSGLTKDMVKGSFWGQDPVGAGDCYWIRTYKNGSLLNLPSDINYAYDAGISSTGNFDGLTFTQPIREGISPLNDEDSNGKRLSPYKENDTVYVEIHSISKLAFNYLGDLKTQTNKSGGISELFSTPLANVSTNISNTNADGSQVVGFFNVAAVHGLGKRYWK